MPSNKNAYMRYKGLDECFRDWRRRYTWKRLLEAVNSELDRHSYTPVSVSTIRAEVEFLKSEEGGGIPL